MTATLIILGVIVLLPLIWLIANYNRMARLRQHIKESWSDIDVEMKRRYELIPNLVETVKAYAKHERETLAKVIELRNKGGAAVNIGGWVLTGTEFAGTCGGERHWQFPVGTMIAANGYIVVAKDNVDPPSEENDGFEQRFGFDPSFEMFDADRTYEADDPTVPNMINTNNEAGQDSQIRLVPGNGFSAACGATFNRYEALYLYNGIPGGGGAIVDVIEYRHPDCTGDTCLGVGSGNNDAFVGFPGIGESLGRNAASEHRRSCLLRGAEIIEPDKAARMPTLTGQVRARRRSLRLNSRESTRCLNAFTPLIKITGMS